MNIRIHPILASLAILAAASPAGLLAEPGRIEAVRGKTSTVRNGMVQRTLVSSKVQPGDGVRTGANGQTQVDAGTATIRAGSDTDLYLKENRNGLTLKSGIVLVSNKSKGGAFDLEADRYKATSYGTMQVSYLKDKYLKVLCVEGKVKVGLKALLGDSVTLQAGQMVTITPTEKRLPEPITVNLARLANTSALLGPGFVVPALTFPGGPRVTATIAGQEQALAQATAGVGKNTRNKTLANSPMTLNQLTNEGNPNYDQTITNEFNARLHGRPATEENMFRVLDEAARGVHYDRKFTPQVQRPR